MRTRSVKNIASRRGGRGPRNLGEGGFALLITVTLLAFLVLLLVSLASLTRVETQVASNTQDQAKARQNALMALNIALGELQKYTGPDQRTTARSDMDASLANTTTKSGRWLGAYGNGAEADYAMAPSAVAMAVKNASDAVGSQAKLLNWLVSGNENTAFNPTSHVGAKGNIVTPPASISFTPTSAVAGLSSSSTALSDSITVGNQPARLLVGPNTAGDSASDYVVAPVREIMSETPGLGSTAVPIGRYAWWIGDENAKARVNLPLATTAQAPNSFVSTQRAAVELMDAVNPSTTTSLAKELMLDPTGEFARYNPANPAVGQIVSKAQLPLLSQSAAASLSTLSKYRYHDIGAWSVSVLADTYRGGLKKDLSAMLATGVTLPASTDFIFPPEPNTTTDTSNQYGVPTWGQLRSFAQTTAASDGLTPKEAEMVKTTTYSRPVATSVGVSPIMTYAALGFQYCAPLGDAPGNPIHLAIFPIVVLWNPYTAAIKPARYKIGIRRTEYGKVELQGHNGPEDSSYAWSAANVIEQKNLVTATSWTDPFFRFIIDASEGIPAGQSRVYTLKTTGLTYNGANELQGKDYNQFHHALMPSTVSIGGGSGTNVPTAAGATYRVGVNADAARVTYNNATTSVTFFGTPDFIRYPWNVAGKTEAYFATDQGDSPRPADMQVYQGAGANSRKWHQSISFLNNINAPFGPYGPNIGYASDPIAQTIYPANYPNPDEKGKWRGLIQSPGRLGPATSPAWRMVVHARFDQSNSRWLVQNNPRALITTSMKGRQVVNYTGADYGEVTWPPRLNVDMGPPDDPTPRTSAGFSPQTTAAIHDATLFEFRPATQPLLSIGQLQHANLAWFGGYPAYAIGNSSGDRSFASNEAIPSQLSRLASQSTDTTYTSSPFSAYYDISWLLNRALWDKYFVSTIPHAGTGIQSPLPDTENTEIPTTLQNPRHTRYVGPNDTALTQAQRDAKLRDVDYCAASMTLTGGFNINSTSEQAWRAILGGNNRLEYDPTGAATGDIAHKGPIFSRFSKPTTNSTLEPWLGYRRLTETQVATLAKNIVDEIRKRGPFISLADFINRRLHNSAAFPQPKDSRLKGTIQAAIDTTLTGPGAINDSVTIPFNKVITAATNAFDIGDTTIQAPYSSPSAYAPQFLTQADVLSSIGSGLVARSDTFVIRCYGDSLNPTDKSQITARAWCEAIVQRLPDYIDSTEPAITAPDAAKSINRQFGRGYKVISFQWITANDI